MVSCFRILESANTAVGTYAVYILVSKAELKTININRFALRLVLFARITSISGLGRPILIYVVGVSAIVIVYQIALKSIV